MMNQEHDNTPRPEDDEFFLLTEELGLPWVSHELVADEQDRVVFSYTVHYEYKEAEFEEKVASGELLVGDDFVGKKQPAYFKQEKPSFDEEEGEVFYLTQALGLKESYEVVAQERGCVVCAHTEYHEYEDIEFENVITEDGAPMDNLFTGYQTRLYIDCLHTSLIQWTERRFFAAGNVGVFMPDEKTSIVPDFLLAMDVEAPPQDKDKKHRSYFVKVIGKVPDLVLEIVSNTEGGEETRKKERYAEMGIPYYVVHDPYHYLLEEDVKVYKLNAEGKYEVYQEAFNYIPELNLGLQLWVGLFQGQTANYQRWCTKDGRLLETGSEAAAHEAQARKEAEERTKAEAQARKREEQARKREEQARKEAEKARREEAEARKELERELAAMRAQLDALGLRAPKDTPPEQ